MFTKMRRAQRKEHLHAILSKDVDRLAKHPNAVAVIGGGLVRNTDDWVRVWIDEGLVFRDETTNSSAHRAISDEGRLLWMIKGDGKRFAYHATAPTPEEAFEEAANATARRRSIAKRWPEVRALRRDILLLRDRVRPTREDARHAGLCEMGVDGFLRRTGLGNRQDYPGYILAIASLFDRQIAYPLFAAHVRQQLEFELTVYERRHAPVR